MFFLVFPSVFRTCGHQKISAFTPSCVFLLYLRLYGAPHSPRTPTTLPMSLYIYNLDETDFINFWNPTYQPTKITLINTSRNVPSLYASPVTFFMWFLNTANISGYIMNPVITKEFYNHQFSCLSSNYLYMSHTSTSTPIHPPIIYVHANFL